MNEAALKRPQRSPLAAHWTLDPAITFLNHGSFGATPSVVLQRQDALRRQMEAEPVRFMVRELEPLLDGARTELATFLGASPSDLVFVQNATAGVNAVLRSLDLDKHDELVTTTHEYNASRNALEYVCAVSGAKPVIVDIPFAGLSADDYIERVLAAVTEKTRLVLVDHISSPTAIVFPIQRLVAELTRRGVDTLVDGAHGPGMLPLDLDAIGAAWYTGNLHKWVCAPKGAAFLHARRNRQSQIHPTSISHGANDRRTDRSRFHLEFDWVGTLDPTAWLCIPEALRVVGGIVPGGWPEVMRLNHALALAGRDLLCQRLGVAPPVADDMLGSMASVLLPPGSLTDGPSLYGDPLQDRLLEEYGIEVPIAPWPEAPARMLRISAQLYNTIEEYEYLAEALSSM